MDLKFKILTNLKKEYQILNMPENINHTIVLGEIIQSNPQSTNVWNSIIKAILLGLFLSSAIVILIIATRDFRHKN